MIEFYSQIKLVHIAAVIASGVLFLLRGAALNAGAGWPMATSVRFLGYSIDTVLLTAALMLMTVLQQYPFAQAWLTVKVILLIVYIVLGSIALGRSLDRRFRLICFGAALLVYGFIITVALAHHPWGVLAGFFA